MPVDPRIALGIQYPDFAQNALRAAQVGSAMQSQQMNALTMSQTQRKMARDLEIENALRQNPNANLTELGQRVGSPELITMGLDAESKRSTVRKNNAQYEKAMQEVLRGNLAFADIDSPEGYAKWYANHIIVSPDDKDALPTPDKWTPDLPQKLRLEASEQYEEQHRQKQLDISRTNAENLKTHRASMLSAAERRAAAAEGTISTGKTRSYELDGQIVTIDAATGEEIKRISISSGSNSKGKTTAEEKKTGYNAGTLLAQLKRINTELTDNRDAERPGAFEAAYMAVGAEGAANMARSGPRQNVYGAQKEIVDTLLHLATGAAYNKEELRSKIDTYLPKWTDKDETVINKRKAIIEQIRQAKIRAGGEWTPELDAELETFVNGLKPPSGEWSIVED